MTKNQSNGNGGKPGAGPEAEASSRPSYNVGWGRPPREHQFKPGHSGNPSGANGKDKSLLSDLDALLERALNSPHTEREQIVTKFAAGIDTLVNQFAEGDHRARRDLFAITEKRGIDLRARRGKVRHLDPDNDAEIRQALLERGIPPRLWPPIDEAGLEPPPDPPLPSGVEDEENKQ